MGRFRFSFAAIVVALAFNSSGVFAQAASQSACDPAPARDFGAGHRGGTAGRWHAVARAQSERRSVSGRPDPRAGAKPRGYPAPRSIGAAPQREFHDHRRGAEGAHHRRGRPRARRGAVLLARPRSLEVKTPYTVAGVRGTEFFIDVDTQRAQMIVYEGTVVADSPAGSLTLRDGQSGVAVANKAPVAQVVARPRDAVHWALYYPRSSTWRTRPATARKRFSPGSRGRSTLRYRPRAAGGAQRRERVEPAVDHGSGAG